MLNLRIRGEEVAKQSGENWTLYHGDCVRVVSALEDDSIGLSVFSPPFSNLYIYSDYLEDMGNCATHKEFFAHFSFLIQQLFRVTKLGRLCAVHCNDQTRQKGIEGVCGLYDFPGEIIRQFEAKGWTFHSRVTIWKDPVIEMQRTKNIGLLHKQIKKDSCASRMGRPDYILAFRKNSLNEANYPDPVTHTAEDFPVEKWQQWASPVWMNIRQTHVLQYRDAKDDEDERHICPLQLDVIERCIALWSNPGDVVLSPFAGIGSEGHMALKMNRKFLGAELKDSYYDIAKRNMETAIAERLQGHLPL